MFEDIRRIVLDEISEGNEIIVETKKKFDLGISEVDVLKSIHFFEEAVDIVPDYLEAWVKLSELYGRLSLWDKAVNARAHS